MEEIESNPAATEDKLRKIKLELKEGPLERRDEVEKQTVRKIIALKRGLIGMVRKIAARVPPRYRREVALIATEEVTSLINNFAGDKPKNNRKKIRLSKLQLKQREKRQQIW